MQAEDCLQLLREMKDVSFASVDETGAPQVRIIEVMIVEENGHFAYPEQWQNAWRWLFKQIKR